MPIFQLLYFLQTYYECHQRNHLIKTKNTQHAFRSLTYALVRSQKNKERIASFLFL